MSKFNAGDRIIVNGNLVATIQSFDEENDRLVFVVTPAGGGSETVYGHISQHRLELLPEAVEAETLELDGDVE